MAAENVHRIAVEVAASYRAGASPQPERFQLHHAVYEVVEILDRWYEGAPRAGGTTCSYFKVSTRNGSTFLLSFQESSAEWFLIKSYGPEVPA